MMANDLGAALREIKRLVAAGRWRLSSHVERDHPERAIRAPEVVQALLRAHAIEEEALTGYFRVTGPARPPSKLVCIVALQESVLVVTAWRRAK